MWIGISGRQIDDSSVWALGVSPVQVGGVLGRGGIGCAVASGVSCGVRCLRRLGWGGCVPFRLQCVCRFFCGAIVARRASGHVVSTKHSRVSLYRSLHLLMPSQLNTPLLLFSDLSARFLDEILRFLYCGTRKPFFGHFQAQAHIGLFQLYTTSLPCHRRRHVEHLQEICCCFKQWDAAITSTI